MRSKFFFYSKRALLLALGVVATMALKGQGYSYYGDGIKINVDGDSSKYIRFITWHQIWTRYSENNTGSNRLGEPASESFDFGLRRSRFLAYAQINDRFLILAHFGTNNQTGISGGANGRDGQRAPFFMHDAFVDYTVFKEHLHLGAGLHYWNGLSRMSHASTLNFLTLDAPITNWPTIDQTDQFARRIGVYAKGRLGSLVYNFSVGDPFQANLANVIELDKSNFSPVNSNKVFDGYVAYEFLEAEGNKLPFMVGTYLGDKKVFNIGGGFLHNSDAMWYASESENGLSVDTAFTNMTLLALDVFADIPLTNREEGGSITAYGVAYFYDMGPNNVRFIGVMNPADGGGPIRGTAVPIIGTGTILYGEVGYALPRRSDKVIIQPYFSLSHGRLEGLRDSGGDIVPVNIYNVGANLLFAGHHAKLTLNYRNRPDFTDVLNVERRNEVVLQTMIYF